MADDCKECTKLRDILKNIINVLAIYDIKHCEFPINLMLEFMKKPKMAGLAVDDKKTLYIDTAQGLTETREAVVHEILHAHHYLIGDLDTKTMKKIESQIERETDKIIERVYGC